MIALDGRALGPAARRARSVHSWQTQKAGHPLRANQWAFLRSSCLRIRKTMSPGTTHRFRLPTILANAGAHVADVRDRRTAVLRRSRHAPLRHDNSRSPSAPARTIGAIDRERYREQREVTRVIVPRAKPIADRGLAFSEAVQITHSVRSLLGSTGDSTAHRRNDCAMVVFVPLGPLSSWRSCCVL